MQGARLLGTGTLSFLENLAGGTFIRVGTLIRNCKVFASSLSSVFQKINVGWATLFMFELIN